MMLSVQLLSCHSDLPVPEVSETLKYLLVVLCVNIYHIHMTNKDLDSKFGDESNENNSENILYQCSNFIALAADIKCYIFPSFLLRNVYLKLAMHPQVMIFYFRKLLNV